MPRQNNFDAIRLLAAVLVVYGHAFPLDGEVSPGLLGNTVQTVAVKTFFVISGYLITQSWYRDPNLFRYFARRALRIGPGLALVVVLSVALLGPAFTTLPLRDYFSSGLTRFYFKNCALYINYALPGVFEKNVYPVAVNGSLWSLPAEVAMYVVVPILWLPFERLARLRVGIAAVTLALCAAGIWFVRVHPIVPTPVVYGLSITSFLDVSPYFLLGALYHLFALERFLDVQVSAVLLFVMAAAAGSAVALEALLMLTLPYVVLSLALAQPARLSGFGRFGDFSYGVYLYGFPVQQMVSATFGKLAPQWNFVISLPFVVALAAVSWHLVEKRALAYKPGARRRAEDGPLTARAPTVEAARPVTSARETQGPA